MLSTMVRSIIHEGETESGISEENRSGLFFRNATLRPILPRQRLEQIVHIKHVLLIISPRMPFQQPMRTHDPNFRKQIITQSIINRCRRDILALRWVETMKVESGE